MMKKNALLLVLLTIALFCLFPLSRLAAQVIQQEKVYIHTNKPNYILGDTLWFKAYVTQGSRNILSTLSGSVYVDVINEQNVVYRSIRLPVLEGNANGDLVFGDDCQPGIYRIRAYTQWMRNKSSDYFFDKSFTVSNKYTNETKVVIATNYEKVEGKSNIITKINYTDLDGKPISAKIVRYKVVADHNTISNNTAKTDDKGSAVIPLVYDQRTLRKQVHIEAYLKVNANTEITKIIPLNIEHADTDVQFFPEGGHLVNGVSSRIGFKAVSVNGSGVKISGKIIDEAGNEHAVFSSKYAGMGSFEFEPQSGKTYKAKVIFPDQSESTFNLPGAFNDNLVLAVSQPSEEFVVFNVKAPRSRNTLTNPLNLLVQSGGEQIFASTVTADQLNSEIKVKKNLFPTGIATVTLYEKMIEPLSERVFFIKKDDSLSIKIIADKNTYRKRSLVQMQVEQKGQAQKFVNGSFSVSVVSEDLVPDDGDKESTILSTLLLSADLKGFIENPNYYFNQKGPEIDRQLDNLMLTQGYRKFTLADFHQQVPPKFVAEGPGISVTGMVKTLGNKPLPDSRVSLIALNSGLMEDAKTDSYGKFRIDGMMIDDGVRFSVQARNPKGGNKVEVIIDQIVSPETGMNKNGAAFNDQQNQITMIQREPLPFKLDRTNRLKEINIRAKKLESVKFTAQGPIQIPEGHADQTFIMSNPEFCATLGICLQGKIHGVMFMILDTNKVINFPHCRHYDPNTNTQQWVSMDVYLDGRKIVDTVEMADIFDGNVIDPVNIGKIEVVRTSISMMSMLQKEPGKGAKGALLIITKRHDKREQAYNPNVAKYIPQGFSKSRQFYSPKYEVATTEGEFDFRSAIYWNPLILSSIGEPLKFDFYTSDVAGSYRAIVEGIDEKGQIGRQVFRFKVE